MYVNHKGVEDSCLITKRCRYVSYACWESYYGRKYIDDLSYMYEKQVASEEEISQEDVDAKSPEALNNFDDKLRSKLGNQQRREFDLAMGKILKNEQLLMFISGGPGIGKTYLATAIIEAVKN